MGWKFVHSDVLRPQHIAPLLTILVGTGTQVLVIAAFTQRFTPIDFLSPSNRYVLLTTLLSFWVLASSVYGYVSACLYKALDSGKTRLVVTLLAALLFQGVKFAIFFLLNLSMW